MTTYIATGEVTTLKHKLWDDAVEFATLVSKALLTSAESSEVLDSLGDYVIIEVEVDTLGFGCGEQASQSIDPSFGVGR